MFLGLDLGTSELKALLLKNDHSVVGTARAPLTVKRPEPLWSEQSPDQWWRALEIVMDDLQQRFPKALALVQAIGLSGQMHGATLLGQEDEVLRPCILWNDGRSGPQCEGLHQRIPALTDITGNLALPGFTAPKLQWVRENEPECFAKLQRVLLPKDWLRLKLTGRAASDMSDAAGTLWLDTGRRDWSDEMLAATGLTRDHMPALVEGNALSAHLLPELARRWGLPDGTPVAGGAGDNAASAVGMGLVRPGQGFVSLGTSGVVFVSGDQFQPNPGQALHTFCHALPGQWHHMSVMLSAASALTWATRMLGYADEPALLEQASTIDAEGREFAPVFLPYLSGERSPHANPHATASWTGLRAQHERAHLAYAAAEGVGFGLLDGLRTIPQPSTGPLQSLSLVGGGSRSAWWAQLLADTLNVKLTVHQDAESGGAMGAARLAWLCSGASVDDVCLTPPLTRSHLPDPASHNALMARYARFKATYPALHSIIA